MAPTKLANVPKWLPKGTSVIDFLEKDIEELVQMLTDGLFISDVAKQWGVSAHALWVWIGKDETRRARVKEAQEWSGEACDQLALEHILAITPDATQAQVARATQAANHLRWRAEKRSIRYAAKQQVEHSGALSLTALVDAAHKPTAPTIDAEAVEVAAEDEAKD